MVAARVVKTEAERSMTDRDGAKLECRPERRAFRGDKRARVRQYSARRNCDRSVTKPA